MSIGLTRLFYVLSEYGMLERAFEAPADVVIIPMTDDMRKAAELSRYLREKDLSVQLYSEDKKFKQKISYADKLSVPFVIVLGEDEIREGKVSLKNMVSGEQCTVSPDEAAAAIIKNRTETASKRAINIR